MSEEKNMLNTMFAGFIIGLLVFVVLFFLFEWTNKFIGTSTGKENLLRLPYSHLLALIVNLLLLRKWIRSDEKENTAKGILIASFLYVLFFFLFIQKNYSPL
ncbi:MAG: hypothetical protein JJE25_06310 [Bacteroidia bacterium]|nr:hypothetical protein [Bacteroidia bacterium]